MEAIRRPYKPDIVTQSVLLKPEMREHYKMFYPTFDPYIPHYYTKFIRKAGMVYIELDGTFYPKKDFINSNIRES
jgi:hypothetical protein